MTIASERIDDVCVLRPAERLDTTTAPVLREVIEKLFESDVRKVLLDLSGISYISSVGLSTCLRGAQLAQARGGRFLLSGPTPAIQMTFEIANLESVLDIHPTREAALAFLEIVAPPVPSARSLPLPSLSLPEELLLLALDDEGGRFIDLPRFSLDFALSAAVLMELCTRARLDSDLDSLQVVDRSPLGDAILDPALAAIARSARRAGVEHWIKVLAHEGASIRDRVIERLVERGILDRKDNLVHWMLGGRRYPVLAERERGEVKVRVLRILRDGDVPAPHDVAIIALADACAVFDAILGMDEVMLLRERIDEVARMDLNAQAMRRALSEVQTWGTLDGHALGVWA